MATLDPKAYFMIFLGAPLVQFKKGTMIEITYDSDAFTDDVAATGEVTRILSADKRATIKCTLDQASPSNDVLSGFAQADRLTGALAGPVIFKDGRGTTKGTGAQAWIKKIPDSSFGTENEGRVWEFRVASLDLFVGGSVTP